MKVLVASNDRLVARLTAKKLESWGHRVTATYDGDEALDHIKREPSRIVIDDDVGVADALELTDLHAQLGQLPDDISSIGKLTVLTLTVARSSMSLMMTDIFLV